MSAIQQLPKVEQLVDLVSHAAAVKLAMDGEFDAKIAELKAAQAALADAQTIASTVAEAQKIKDDADAYAAAALAKASDALDRALQANDKSASREALVTGRETAASSREAMIEQRQAAQDAREQSLTQAQAATAAAFDRRDQALKNAEADIAAKRKKLADDQAAFNQKLEALKV